MGKDTQLEHSWSKGPGGRMWLRNKRTFCARSWAWLFVPVMIIVKTVVTRVDRSQVFIANPEWCGGEPSCFIPRNHLVVEREMPILLTSNHT